MHSLLFYYVNASCRQKGGHPSLSSSHLPALLLTHVPDVVPSPVSSPTHVQLTTPAGVYQPCFVIIKPPLLALLSLIYVTCMGLPLPAVEGLTLFCPDLMPVCEYASVWLSECSSPLCVHVHIGMCSCPCVPVCSLVCVFVCPCRTMVCSVCVCVSVCM